MTSPTFPLVVRRYMRNPLYVEAVPVTAANMAEVAEWCGGEILLDGKAKAYIKVDVLRPTQIRQGQAFVGDWILKTATGYKVYSNKAFMKDFTEAPEMLPGPDNDVRGRVLGSLAEFEHVRLTVGEESDPKAVELLEAVFADRNAE